MHRKKPKEMQYKEAMRFHTGGGGEAEWGGKCG